jgi:hypothetical protein
MYTAKAAGRDQYVVYEPTFDHAEPLTSSETPNARTPHPKPHLE